MGHDCYVVCGDAKSRSPHGGNDNSVRLHLYGPNDDDKIALRIEDIRRQMYKDIPKRYHDLLDIATYVFTADQVFRRGQQDVQTFGSCWRRNFHFLIPVRDLDFWKSDEIRQRLESTLSFLSDDHYDFQFVGTREQQSVQQFFKFDDDADGFGRLEQVVMYSGGLDSLAGAIEESINQRANVVLVNHRSTPKLDTHYRKLREAIKEKCPNNPPTHIRVTVHKKKGMNKERTQRSRSFLYVTLGATIAKMLGLPGVRFYENGIISLNLPICAQVVGGKATRTTHPKVIHDFESLLSEVNSEPVCIENPFRWKTKGEVVDHIARSGCAEMIGDSISCTHIWTMSNEHPHCGYCSQCIDRRFAVLAANIEEYDPLPRYGIDIFTESRSQHNHVNKDKMLFASYLERANEVDRVEDSVEFLSKYPEAARTLAYVNGTCSSGLERSYDLYKRHAAEVNYVIDKMLAKHGRAIRQRSLPGDSMLRVVYESKLPVSVPVTSHQVDIPDNIFRRRGSAWEVRFQGRQVFTVAQCKGADYLHYLLSSPGKAIDVTDLICGAEAEHCGYLMAMDSLPEEERRKGKHRLLADLGSIADKDALREYYERVTEINGELDRARRKGDHLLVRELEDEREKIFVRIREAYRLDGGSRKAGDKRKSMRDSFRANVKRLIAKQIKETDPDLAEHLRRFIKFGNTPKYEPANPISWQLTPLIE